jgi:hypothetical protein
MEKIAKDWMKTDNQKTTKGIKKISNTVQLMI